MPEVEYFIQKDTESNYTLEIYSTLLPILVKIFQLYTWIV